MNVLRELRKFKTKSAMAKIRVLIILAVMLVASTYAWWSIQKDVAIRNLTADVEAWDVEYYVDGDKKENSVTIAIDEFYPGAYLNSAPFEKKILIKNKADGETIINYEVTKVELFGEDKTTETEIYKHDETEKRIEFFTNEDEYPFNIECTYDKTEIKGHFIDKEEDELSEAEKESNEAALATVNFKAYWNYGSEDEYTNADKADTKLGEEAYEHYDSGESYGLLITLKITSSKKDDAIEP